MKRKNLIYYIIMFLPILDLLTSIQRRYFINSLSIGAIVKGITILFAIFYIFFLSFSKYKKRSIWFLIIIFMYIILYFIFKPDIISEGYLYNEINYLMKMIYFPILFAFMLNYFDEYGFNKKLFNKTMIFNLIMYTLLLLVPNLFHMAFNSYNSGLHGFVGWFYAANEVGVIITLLLPFMYLLLNKKYSFLISLPILYAISSIGTKVSFIGAFIVLVLTAIFVLCKNRFKINIKSFSVVMILLIGVCFFFVFNRYTIDNTKIISNNYQVKDTSSKLSKILNSLLSNRDDFYLNTKKVYNNTFRADYLLFGMGNSNTLRINDPNVTKLIEIDYLDLFFHFGIFGLIIELLPVLIMIKFVITYLSKVKDKDRTLNILYNTIIICMVLGTSLIAGHILFYPAVSIYLCLYLIMIINETKVFNKTKIKNRKVSFLALHLKQGGIETVTINKANMLADDFDVEIICLYKDKNKIPYDINKNVKITYLMNTISNRDKIHDSLNNRQIITLIKELFKAIKILFWKKRLIRKSILNSDARVIISTRMDFARILGNYARDGVIKISDEHSYHNLNINRINEVIFANEFNDYFMPTSKELCNFYEDKINPKVKYIPNVINYYPKIVNKLNTKKIIAIGRLVYEKGFDDLIKVMSVVHNYDKNITLDIYGEGEEREYLESLIYQNKLENVINLKGNVPFNKLNEIRNNYSLVVCTSHEESFGLAVLETMAFGIPCITFDDAKGLLEFVNEENGSIIENRNIEMMAKRIIDLFSNQNKLNTLGRNAFLKAKEYDFNVIKNKYIEFINEVIGIKYHNKKVMFISSTGGHLNELMQLKPLFNKYNYEIVTEKEVIAMDMKKEYGKKIKFLLRGTKYHPFPYFLWILPLNTIISLYYYLKFKPSFIITTGSHTAGPMCVIGKMFGSKVIYIETFANIHTKTITGKIVYHFADVFIVQWESMLELYPDAHYGGWIF